VVNDVLLVLKSVFSAAIITVAAYGFGRPCLRLFDGSATDRFERTVRSLLIGFPVAGVALAVPGVLGWLTPVSVWLITCIGLISACTEAACLIAVCVKLRDLHIAIGAVRMASTSWQKAVGGVLAVALGATLIGTLAPPTSEALLARTLGSPKLAITTNTFWTGEQGGFEWLPLPQIWSLWGLVLDGPVAASLVHWHLGIVVALAAALLARNWGASGCAWLAGALIILSLGCQTDGNALSSGMAIGLTGAWLFLSLTDLQQRGSRIVGQVNLAIAALVASLPGAAADMDQFNVWQQPLLMIALGGLVLGPPWHRPFLSAAVIVPLAASLLPGYSSPYWIALPGLAAMGAFGIAQLRSLPRPARSALAGLVAFLGAILLHDLAWKTGPKMLVALGLQSRHSYLLAASGSYRAATVYNQIRLPDQKLLSTDPANFYFASATSPIASPNDEPGAEEIPFDKLVEEASARGCGYLLVSETLQQAPVQQAPDSASTCAALADRVGAAEKFAGAAEVIPIVDYDFADEYQRTTRYRLWKLQSRRAAASPMFESAPRGEEVSSRPRLPMR
jgi:hypothetical protein